MNTWFNLGEAVLWVGIAVLLTVYVLRKRPSKRFLYTALILGFFAFGISDLVEIWSGAWWRPWWLLAWKSACLAVLAPALCQLYQTGKGGRSKELGKKDGG